MMKLGFSAIGFVVGAFFSFLALQFRLISFDLSMSLGNLVQSVATVLVAVAIPLTVIRGLDNNKRKREMVLKELEKLEVFAGQAQDFLRSIKSHGVTLSDESRQELLAKFENISRQTGSLERYLKLVKSIDAEKNLILLNEGYYKLKDSITGGSLFVSNYVVDNLFMEVANASFHNYKTLVNCVILETIPG